MARDLGSAADLDPHSGPKVTLDLGSAADMFVGSAIALQAPDAWKRRAAVAAGFV